MSKYKVIVSAPYMQPVVDRFAGFVDEHDLFRGASDLCDFDAGMEVAVVGGDEAAHELVHRVAVGVSFVSDGIV